MEAIHHMGRKYHLWLLSRKIFLKEKRHKVKKSSSRMTQTAWRRLATLLSIALWGGVRSHFLYLFIRPTRCGTATFQIGSCWETHPKFVSCNFNDQKSKMHCALIFMGGRGGREELRNNIQSSNSTERKGE